MTAEDEQLRLGVAAGRVDELREEGEEEDRDRNMVAARNWFDRWLVEEEDTSVLLWAPRE